MGNQESREISQLSRRTDISERRIKVRIIIIAFYVYKANVENVSKSGGVKCCFEERFCKYIIRQWP